ncbi:Uncharacterised protein [Zhongshania aliphaticivorans]|uniref:PepSY domain-containing protein n=1 Tax=Zhongshania aliphaticivorans TaxID=1470434 RepID=A0A5S9N617_9GAMM|nr:PepSY-associated TM helix domain-containing protein [Zhongshania aliphaticivorans]CAA0082441.1 Uncharacterised protein [Zhongshania aliphaticivorans]CAA0084299.1 Uncharacterised protein [Zhongshania aliphaticivorans]
MSRKLFVSIHLYLAAFFAPVVIVMAVSGGLYLMDYKGEVTRTHIGHVAGEKLDANSKTLRVDVLNILATLNVDARVESVRVRGENFYTRPSSGRNYTLRQSDTGVNVEEVNPNLQAAMMELHKGHGPAIYKLYEKLFAIALVLIMLSGLYLGWMSPLYKRKMLLLSGAGIVVFVLTILV